jgi:uncharacterized protein (DUF2252 family)
MRAVFATLIPDLVPLRISRMGASPFAFFRGSAAIMAADLSCLPRTGIATQLCGDAHLANFGGFASPERQLVFDVDDFDETARGPWEWDLKRLATSVVLAAEEHGVPAKRSNAAMRLALRTYRDRTAEYAAMPAIDRWYAAIDLSGAVRNALDARARAEWLRTAREARHDTSLEVLPKLTKMVDGALRFVEHPPLLEHVTGEDMMAVAKRGLTEYRASLRHDARLLLDRFSIVDVARKVVGVGSVGTWCLLMLLADADGNPLLLQIKEARASALEPFVDPPPYASHGERVVAGQLMMQAASDVLLGWTGLDDRSVYVRQYRDMKAAPDLTTLRADELQDYAAHCAWALARAHARTGEPRAVATYIGRSERFVEAVAGFAGAYAEQVRRDHAAFVAAYPPATATR